MKGRISAALLVAFAWPAAAEVTVTAVGERVSVRAVAAPLDQVLDQLALKTGMKVVYEGSHPRQQVTLTIESRTPTEAVLAVLEGQGVNFGLRTDASGAQVERLLLAGLAPVASSAPAAAPASRPPAVGLRAPVPIPEPEEDLRDDSGEEAAPPKPRPQQPPKAEAAPAPILPQPPNYPNSPFAPKPNVPATPAPPPVPEDDMP